MLVAILSTAIAGVASAILARRLERRWYPLAVAGGRAPAWVLGAGRSRRAVASATDVGGLLVTSHGHAPIHLPTEVLRERLQPSWKEELRVGAGFSVKLQGSSWRVFLRPADWATLTDQKVERSLSR